MRETVRVVGWWAGRVLAALVALAGLGALAAFTMPPLAGRVVAWYEGLVAEGGPVDFGLPVLLALLAVALVIGRRARPD
jgi:hypothetical protein